MNIVSIKWININSQTLNSWKFETENNFFLISSYAPMYAHSHNLFFIHHYNGYSTPIQFTGEYM